LKSYNELNRRRPLFRSFAEGERAKKGAAVLAVSWVASELCSRRGEPDGKPEVNRLLLRKQVCPIIL